MAAADKTGRDVGAYTLVTVIAAPTDEMAFAKWDHYRAGTDMEAIAWARGQSGAEDEVIRACLEEVGFDLLFV